MKLLRRTKSKVTEDENGEDVPHIGINEVVPIHVILLTTITSKIQESYIHLFLINHLVNY